MKVFPLLRRKQQRLLWEQPEAAGAQGPVLFCKLHLTLQKLITCTVTQHFHLSNGNNP